MRYLGCRRIALPTVAAVTLSCGGAVAVSASASAATLAVDQPCYVLLSGGAPMQFTGSGFVPNDLAVITSPDGTVDVSVRVDADGNISGSTEPPAPAFSVPAMKTVTITAIEQTTTTTIQAQARVLVTVRGWEHGSVKPARGYRALTEKTNWLFSGFSPGQPIFGHYLYRGRPIATARFGVAQGPCGLLKARARLYPAIPHHAAYRVQYDDSRAYSPASRPRILGPISLGG